MTPPSSHDKVAIGQPVLTRSVVVSYLSWYLQHPTLTSDIVLKYFNHLKPFIIVTRYLGQPHPTLQIPRHTCLATGTNPLPTNGTVGRIASPGNVTYYNCRAVSGKAIGCNTMTSNAQARVWRPIPATVASPPNTCFFACLDSAV